MRRCKNCGKPTKSHISWGDGITTVTTAQCHICYLEEEGRRKEEEKQKYLRRELRDKEFSEDFEDVEEKEVEG